MKTDEDLEEVTRDIVNDYKAEARLNNRVTNRRTARLVSSSQDLKMK